MSRISHASTQTIDYYHECPECHEKFICRIPTMLFLFSKLHKVREVEEARLIWKFDVASHALDHANQKVEESLHDQSY